jgi:hypothetical protein
MGLLFKQRNSWPRTAVNRAKAETITGKHGDSVVQDMMAKRYPVDRVPISPVVSREPWDIPRPRPAARIHIFDEGGNRDSGLGSLSLSATLCTKDSASKKALYPELPNNVSLNNKLAG